MNLEIVAQLMRMMEESSLTAMEVEECGFRIRLEHASQPGALFGSAEPRTPVHPAPQPAAASPDDTEAPAPQPEEPTPHGAHDIKSPMVGTFHERKGTKVSVGTALKKGEPVCIVEAMKVMNEILMEQDGVITYVAAQEGDMVEFGQTLYLFD